MPIQDQSQTELETSKTSNATPVTRQAPSTRFWSVISESTEYLFPWCIFLAPFLIFSYRFPLGIRYAAATLLLVPALMRGLFLRRSWPGRGPVLLLVLCSLPSLYATDFPEITTEKLMIHALAISVYIGIVSVRRDLHDLMLLTLLLTGATVLLAVLGPFTTEYAAKGKFLPTAWVRILPFRLPEILDANLLANVIGMVLPIVLAFGLWGRKLLFRRGVQLGCWMLLGLLGLGLLLTESRAGYLAVLVAISLVLGFYYERAKAVLMIVGLGTFVVFFLIPYGSFLDSATGSVSTLEGRREVWERAISMIWDFPWTGIGAGTFSEVGPLLYPFLVHPPSLQVQHAHSLFLQAAVDFGIPGLMAFLSLLACTLVLGRNAWRKFKVARNDLGCALAVGYSCGLVVMVVHGILDAPLWLTKPAPLPFFLMGILAALSAVPAQEGELSDRKSAVREVLCRRLYSKMKPTGETGV